MNYQEKALHVLLVDDDEDEFIVLKELIRKSTFKPGNKKIQLDWAPSYPAAIKAFANTAYDAALVDYRLGEHSGLDLLKEINQREVKIPVILLTGQGNYDVDIAAMEGGAADYLLKDQVDAPLLERTIRYAIEQQKVREELEVRVRERTAELEQANNELRAIQLKLEDRVIERTAALTEANQKGEQLLSQLAVEQARLQAVIENAASGIVVVDESGQVILSNPVADRLLNRAARQGQAGCACSPIQSDPGPFDVTEGQVICITGSGKDDNECQLLYRAAVQGEFFSDVEIRVQPPGEEPRYVLASITPIKDPGGRRNGAVGIFQDITFRKQMEEDLQQRAERGQLLASLTGSLAEAGLNDRAALDAVTRLVAERIGDVCTIRLVSEDGQNLLPVSFFANQSEGYEQMRSLFASHPHDVNDGPSGHVMRTGKSLLIPGTTAEQSHQEAMSEYQDWMDRYPVCSLLIAPLKLKDRTSGVLTLMRLKTSLAGRRVGAYSAEDLRFIEELAAHTSMAIENARLYEEVQRLSVTDPLTGLYNRRGLEAISENELRRAHRLQLPVGLVIIDIDHFKRVNDSYGHPAGDEVLKELALRLRGALRNQDVLARYGGEEFAILLPESSQGMAYTIAERLRRMCQIQPFETEAGRIGITISLGVVVDADTSLTLPAMIERADAALYRSKQNGRNRVEIG